MSLPKSFNKNSAQDLHAFNIRAMFSLKNDCEMAWAIVRVAALALIFEAGIPMLYALGMRAHAGDSIRDETGEVIADTEPTPQMRALGWAVYGSLAVIIVAAIVWVAKDSIEFYTGWAPFGAI